MLEPVEARELLRRGDALLEQGDTGGAIAQYLLYCALPDAGPLECRSGRPTVLKRCGIRRQVLRLDPALHAVRRSLADDYAALGLVDDAAEELALLAEGLTTAGASGAVLLK